MEKKVKVISKPQDLPQNKKVGIYCRVSSNTKAQLHSLANQASYLLQYVNNTPLLIATDIFLDVESGRDINKRIEFQRMLNAAQNGSINYIVTKSISRFGRSAEEILETLRFLKGLNIDVYFEEQGITSTLEETELYISLYSGIAQEENRQHSENVKWGIKRSIESGKSNLYSKPCYGYKIDKNNNLYIDENEATIVRRIFAMYLNGSSILKIKYALETDNISSPTGKEQWSKRTIEFILANTKYYGTAMVYKSFTPDYSSKRKANTGEHTMYMKSENNPVIITEDIFNQVQEEKQKRSNVIIDEYGNKIRKNDPVKNFV